MKKTLLFSFFLLILSISPLIAQQQLLDKLGLNSYSIQDKDLGTINYYVTKTEANKKKPLLLYLDGSGTYPLFSYTKRGLGSTVPLSLKKLAAEYHIVLISKPSIPLVDSAKVENPENQPYPENAEYNKILSLDWRVNSADKVIKKVLKDFEVDNKKIAVLGISEGFQVGAKLATVNKKITHLMLFVGNGLTQFYDFIIQNRLDAQSGLISDVQAQTNIDSIYTAVKKIYANPKATDKFWYGHTYLRWSSFCANNPTENLTSLNIPIYLVGASRDRNSSILGTDYLNLEAIRINKTNISYKVYPYDHSFNSFKTDPDGKSKPDKNHLMEVVNESLDWLKQH